MPVIFSLEEGNIGIFKVSGVLGKDELDLAQRECEVAIKKIGNINILVILDNFQGWKKSKDWDDLSFPERNDPYINKIAIVGDKQWEDLAYAFTVKDLRPVPIKFFDVGQENTARIWLSGNS